MRTKALRYRLGRLRRGVWRHGCRALLFQTSIDTRTANAGTVRERRGCIREGGALLLSVGGLFLGADHRKILAVAKGTRRLLFLLWPHLQETFGAHASMTTCRSIDLTVIQKTNGAFFRDSGAAIGAFLSFEPRGDAAVADQSSNGFFIPMTRTI